MSTQKSSTVSRIQTHDSTPIMLILLLPASATVSLTQTFWQCSSSATPRARYVFPVPAQAAVCGFEMCTEDGRVIAAVVKEKEVARKEHEQAIETGRMTGLVEYVADDGTHFSSYLPQDLTQLSVVFSISLGCLPRYQLITTKLTVRLFHSCSLALYANAYSSMLWI